MRSVVKRCAALRDSSRVLQRFLALFLIALIKKRRPRVLTLPEIVE
jgi:hypothetical protein